MSNAQDQLKLYLEYFFSESYDNVYNLCYDSSNRDHILSNLKQLGKNKINDTETLAEFRSFVADNFVDMGFFDFFDKLEEYIQIQNKIICLLYGVEMKKEYDNLSALETYMKEMSACMDECKQLFTKIEKNIASEPIIPAPASEPIIQEPIIPAPAPEPVIPEPIIPAPAPESIIQEPVIPAPAPEPVIPEPVLRDPLEPVASVPAPEPVIPEPVIPEPAPEPVVPEPIGSDGEIDYDAVYGDRKSYQLLMKEVQTSLGVIDVEIDALSKKEDRTFYEEVKLRKLIKDKATLKKTAIEKYVEKYGSKFNRVSKKIDQQINKNNEKIKRIQEEVKLAKEEQAENHYSSAIAKRFQKRKIDLLEERIDSLKGSNCYLEDIQFDIVHSKFKKCSSKVSSLNNAEAKSEVKQEKDLEKAINNAERERIRRLQSLERDQKVDQMKQRLISFKDSLVEKIDNLKRKRIIAQSDEPIQQQLNNDNQNHMTH